MSRYLFTILSTNIIQSDCVIILENLEKKITKHTHIINPHIVLLQTCNLIVKGTKL